jgi:hypothetical protein
MVVERAGRIRLVKGGVTQPVAFLDIAAKVDSDGEEGLLSVTFPPDYATTRLFYVFYTHDVPDVPGSDIVVEERRAAATFDAADPAYARQVLRIPHREYSNHIGGQLQFGPDRMLWIATGDGGGGNDVLRNAQNRGTLLGKLLRVDPRAGGGCGGGCTIPAGNPFARGGGAPEVWAWGLRNPWRFSFDRATGDLYVGDVGQGQQEEVDRVTASSGLGCGANYGWPIMEGTVGGPPPSRYVAPWITHTRTDGWRAIAGGHVLRDASVTDLHGRYVYGDFFKPRLYGAFTATAQTAELPLDVAQLAAFGEDAAARLYTVSLGGAVHRLVPDGGGSAPTQPAPGLVGVTVPGCDLGPPRTDPGPGPGPGPGTGQTPGDQPPGGQPVADRTPPRLYTRAVGRQRALRKRYVSVRVRCSERCAVRVAGAARSGRRRYAVVTKRATLAADRARTLRVRVNRRTRTRIARLLRARRRVRIELRVRAADGAGNAAARTVRIAVRR